MASIPGDAVSQMAQARGEGIPFSRFLLYPSVSIGFEHDDNLLSQSVDSPDSTIVSTGATLIRPVISMEMPFGASRVRWSYAALFRNYADVGEGGSDSTSEFFDLEGGFREGSPISFTIKDHYVKDIIEAGRYTGSPELYGLVPFTIHAPEFGTSWWYGARSGVTVLGRLESVAFHDDGPGGFYDYDRQGVEARFNHRVSAPTVIYGFLAHENTVQTRTESTSDQVDVTDRRIGVGVSRTVNEVVVTRFAAGYQTLDFVGGSDSNFAGLSASGTGSFRLGDTGVLELGLIHQPYQSFYFNNNYLLNNEIRGRLVSQTGRGLVWTIGMTYGGNTYSDPLDLSDGGGPDSNGDGCADSYDLLCDSAGTYRRDRYVRYELGAVYQFSPQMRVAVGYNREERRSNQTQRTSIGTIIDPFHYEINRVFIRLEAGWM